MREGFGKIHRITVITAMAALMFLAAPGASVFAKSAGNSGKQAKYVFFFIGDGVGFPQLAAAEQYSGKKMMQNRFPAQGVTTTYAADRFITGSAAAATALGSGQKTNIGMIGMAPDQKPVKSVAELAKESGKKVGIISSVSIDHATPAAFYAHVRSRKMYHEIDHALVNSGFDFFGGGGMKDPMGKKSKAPLGDALEAAKEKGYKIVDNKEEFSALGKKDGKIIAWNQWLQDVQSLPYTLDQRKEDITIVDFTKKAIELLDNEKGFFLMVEGGKIDWACHANDAAASITNTLAFDEALKCAVDFYNDHPDETLIVATGDHECGGLTLGFAGTKYESYFTILENQKVSFQKFTDEIVKNHTGDFEDMKQIITAQFGLKYSGNSENDIMVLSPYEQKQIYEAYKRSFKSESEEADKTESYLLYGEYDPLSITLTHILNRKAGLGWTSYKHTAVPVGTSAIGVGAETFNGYYDNTDVALKIMVSMGIRSKVHASGISNGPKVAVH